MESSRPGRSGHAHAPKTMGWKAAGPSHLRGGELARAQRLLRRIAGLALRQAQHERGLVVRCAAGRDAVA